MTQIKGDLMDLISTITLSNGEKLDSADLCCKVLNEVLSHIKVFSGETFVVKFGGSAMGDPEVVKAFASDVATLKQVGINVVVVHGGGPQIEEVLAKLGIKTSFVEGLRVSDRNTVEAVEMVLSGVINKNIAAEISKNGVNAMGISGKDSNLIIAKRISRTYRYPDSNIERILDLGFVGEPTKINTEILATLEESDIIPVIAPIGIDSNGETYNINADIVAGAIAVALNASKLVFLSNVAGVMNGKELVSRLEISVAEKLVENGVITDGMIPKVRNCVDAIKNGVENVHIIDGSVKHILLTEIFTKRGVGTMFYNEEDLKK